MLSQMQTYTLEQVKQHATSSDCWVIVNGKVYDVTNFLFDHPGGEALILDHSGRDITSIMKDDMEHVHSDTAYDMLNDYCIGVLDSSASSKGIANTNESLLSRKSNDFIDTSKPMLQQILKGNYSKEFYVQQIHIPRHTTDSPPIFVNPYLDLLSKCYWWVPPTFWSPVIIFMFVRSLSFLSIFGTLASFALGIFTWTLIEYSLHRFIFHLDEYLPDNKYFMAAHFISHGVHHFLPMDSMRLVMPPALGVILATPIITFIQQVLPHGVSDGLVSGALLGFISYDLFHYYLHHSKPYGSYTRKMKTYHLDHHYKNFNLGYGVTSRFWDVVFSTKLW